MHTRNNISGKLGFYISGVTDVESARPLDFLNKMDESEEALRRMIRNVHAGIEYGEDLLKDLSCSPSSVVFPSEIVEAMEKEQDNLASYFHVFMDCKDTFMKHRDAFFKPEDTLLETLEEGISVAKQLHAQMETIKWSIMEHNVDALPKSDRKPISTSAGIDSFFDSL